ncbi:hypothetical protein FHL15_001293 [Xylaria flabelliformis]|uniref:Uncharacterized protein n=1 Tax=Xylaria flabelliformis TaxID=2512241 RepID=A0A553ICZ8_9PEZI|nr:hypothetical protein FHL15_001293 [Xylaria flabelliformis]
MSGSARARGGPAPPAVTQPTVAKSKVSKSGSTSTAQLAVKKKKKTKNVIVIDSDDEDVSDYGGYACDSANGLPTPRHTSSVFSDHAVPETPTKNGGRASGRIAALVRSLNPTLRNSPATTVSSSDLDCPHSSKKTNGLVHRRGESSIKDADTSGRGFLHTPCSFTSSNSPRGAQLSKSQSCRTSDGIETSRQKPNNTLTPAAIKSSEPALPRPSSTLPLAFAPAVKPRIYSASRPGGRQNVDIKSKKLEAFGFVSATSLLPRNTTRDATTIPPITNTQNAPAAAVTTLPNAKLEPVSKTTSKPIKQEPSKVRFSATRLLPRTPEKPVRAKRAHTPSYSSGTHKDPYAISSDSDDGNPYSCPPLRSFAEIADTYETASDVEAVLNQFPAWLDSPSPTPRSTTSSILGKRLWGDGTGNRGRGGGDDSRRVRFCEGDGFSTSPVPAKRAIAPSRRLTPFEEERATFSAKRDASPITVITSPARLTSSTERTSSPTRRAGPLKRADPLVRKTSLTQRDTFPLQEQLTPTRQTTTSLNSSYSCSSPPLAKKPSTTPRVEIAISDSEPEPASRRDHSNEEDMDMNMDPNPNPNSNLSPDHGINNCCQNRGKNSIHQQQQKGGSNSSSSIPIREKEKKKKKKRRKRKKGGHNNDVVASGRHRNRDRGTWKDGKRLKREMKGFDGLHFTFISSMLS